MLFELGEIVSTRILEGPTNENVLTKVFDPK